MGTFKFSMRMLVKDYKKSIFYGITLVFAVAVCFVFFNIINITYKGRRLYSLHHQSHSWTGRWRRTAPR